MAVAAPSPIILSDSNMIQVERQINGVEHFNGDPQTLYTFISRIDFILALYQTTDERQKLTIFGHIERNIAGEVIRTLGVTNLTTWTELRTHLILNYKPQRPNHLLLEDFRNTQFRGNVREFLEEAERRRQILTNKLDLESDTAETTLYNQLIRTSIETLILKLPTHIQLKIVKCEIPNLRSLINILQEKGIYEIATTYKNNTKPVSNPIKSPNNATHRQTTNYYNHTTPFQPSYNAMYQPIRQPISYIPPQLPRTNPNPFSQYQYRQLHPQPNVSVIAQPRPLNRQHTFDQNRPGLSYSNALNTRENITTGGPALKRQRPSDSGQSRMSFDEAHYQEELDQTHQQFNPYMHYGNHPQYPFDLYMPYGPPPNNIPIYYMPYDPPQQHPVGIQEMAEAREEPTEPPMELITEAQTAENFRPQASEQANS